MLDPSRRAPDTPRRRQRPSSSKPCAASESIVDAGRACSASRGTCSATSSASMASTHTSTSRDDMIGIGDYNFDGQFFARWDGAPFITEDRRALRSMIVDRAFNLPRWRGEPGRDGPLSVGRHSIMVGVSQPLLAVREGQRGGTPSRVPPLRRGTRLRRDARTQGYRGPVASSASRARAARPATPSAPPRGSSSSSRRPRSSPVS